ncbi:MAG: hypothetical protein GWN86_25085 [Desulfobacterales bacterium]|nr:hypothetical protein [Desulfobacterales bacterium]
MKTTKKHKIAICLTILIGLLALLPLYSATIANAQEMGSFFTLHLHCTPEGSYRVEYGEVIKRELAKIGINVELEVLDWSVIRAMEIGEEVTKTFEEGGMDMWLSSGRFEIDPDLNKQEFESSSMFERGGRMNAAGINDAYMDWLMAEQATEMNETRREELWEKFCYHWMDEMPVVPMIKDQHIHAFSDDMNTEGIDFYSAYRGHIISDPIFCLQKAHIPGKDTIVFAEWFTTPYLWAYWGWSYNAGWFRTLVRWQPDYTIAPDLAESWNVSSDQKTYTFHLRDTVWYGGEGEPLVPLTSEDVKFTYDTIMREDSPSWSKAILEQYIESIETPDNSTVVIHLHEPSPIFLWVLGFYNQMEIVPKHWLADVPFEEWSEYQANNYPPSIGPWRVIEVEWGDHYKYEANPYYWDGEPPTKYLIYKIIPETATQLSSYKAGELDLLDMGFTHIASEIEALPNTETRRVQYALHLTLNTNNRHPILNNPLVRKAIAHSLPLDEINAELNGGYGFPSNLPMPPEHPFLPEDITDPLPYNIETAKQLMEQAGYDYDLITTEPTVLPLDWIAVGVIVGLIVGAGATAAYLRRKQ